MAFLLGGIALAWRVAGFGGDTVSSWANNILGIFPPAFAAWACFTARRRGSITPSAWLLLGLAAASWGLGQVVWLIYENILHQAPYPSWADVAYLSGVTLAIPGVLAFQQRRRRIPSFRDLLDGLIIATSVLFLSWMTVLEPLFEAATDGVLAKLLGLAYPVIDVVTISILLFVLGHLRNIKRHFVLVGTGLLGIALADSLFFYVTLDGDYSTTSLIGAGWIFGFLLVGTGALVSLSEHPAPAADSERPTVTSIALPLAPMLGIVVPGGIVKFLTGGLDIRLFSLAIVALFLMLVRQFLMFVDYLSLTRSLERRVTRRTEQLRRSETRFRSLLQNSSDLTVVIDEKGLISYSTPTVKRLLGYEVENVTGRPVIDFVAPDDHERITDILRKLRQSSGPETVEAKCLHADGSTRWMEVGLANLLEDKDVRGIVANHRDITDRKLLEQKLLRQAFNDDLTGLANRALLTERLNEGLIAASPRKPIAVLFLDLDDFKTINDSLGHTFGDQLLTAVAARLKDLIRPSDTAARLGGDEFAVLMQGVRGAKGAEVVAERILTSLHQPFLIQGHELYARCSIGIVVDGGESSSAEDVLRNADLAMYTAKSRGKACYEHFVPGMREAAMERMHLKAELQRALERNEFTVHYQPVVDLFTGIPKGVEALLRWTHPEKGNIPPNTFVPLAEETGLIVDIGSWVLKEATTQVDKWNRTRAGAPLTVSVNLSARQLHDSTLLSHVAAALGASRLPPEQLVLEITETVIMQDTEATIEQLSALKRLGVKLAIDDFGTGYSSLGYLQRFPIDILKIDRSFVSGMTPGSGQSRITRGIVGLSKTLGLKSVAEGVETQQELEQLQRSGCDCAQGYLFSRPLPPEEALDKISDLAAPAVSPAPTG